MRFYGKKHPAKTTIFLLFIFGFLTSCDCIQHVQGYAIDAETKKPLSKVSYKRDSLLTAEEKLMDISDPLYHYQRRTDSVGWFEDFRLANGFNCKPHLILWFEKEGYEPVRLEWNRKRIYMDTLIVELHRKAVGVK